jgi:hypothetical protein
MARPIASTANSRLRISLLLSIPPQCPPHWRRSCPLGNEGLSGCVHHTAITANNLDWSNAIMSVRRQSYCPDCSPVHQHSDSSSGYWSVPAPPGCEISTHICRLQRRVHINRRAGRPVVPIALFYIAVLFWDTVEAVSNMINIRWSHDGRIATGNTCFAQGMLPCPFLG